MSPFAGLVDQQRVKLQPWPEHARRSHHLMVPADRERVPEAQGFDEKFIAGTYAKVRMRAKKIADIVRERGEITALELCPLVGAPRRTIYRDVALLVEAGAPIHGSPEHGYRWQKPK